MNQYCVKCGREIRKDAAFCPHCGQRLSSSTRQTDDWNEFGNFLAHSGLGLAKGFLYLLMGGIIFACAVSGVGMLVIGAILLYHFATSGFFILPAVLVPVFGIETLRGAPLVFGGIAAVFISLLFIIAVISVIKAVRSLRHSNVKPVHS